MDNARIEIAGGPEVWFCRLLAPCTSPQRPASISIQPQLCAVAACHPACKLPHRMLQPQTGGKLAMLRQAPARLLPALSPAAKRAGPPRWRGCLCRCRSLMAAHWAGAWRCRRSAQCLHPTGAGQSGRIGRFRWGRDRHSSMPVSGQHRLEPRLPITCTKAVERLLRWPCMAWLRAQVLRRWPDEQAYCACSGPWPADSCQAMNFFRQVPPALNQSVPLPAGPPAASHCA